MHYTFVLGAYGDTVSFWSTEFSCFLCFMFVIFLYISRRNISPLVVILVGSCPSRMHRSKITDSYSRR